MKKPYYKNENCGLNLTLKPGESRTLREGLTITNQDQNNSVQLNIKNEEQSKKSKDQSLKVGGGQC